MTVLVAMRYQALDALLDSRHDQKAGQAKEEQSKTAAACPTLHYFTVIMSAKGCYLRSRVRTEGQMKETFSLKRGKPFSQQHLMRGFTPHDSVFSYSIRLKRKVSVPFHQI